MSSDIISLREFARRLTIGEKTIRDGVRTGKISKGVIIENGKPKIDYKIALKEALSIGLGRKSTNKQTNHCTEKEIEFKISCVFANIRKAEIQLEKARLNLEVVKSGLEILKIKF